MQTGEVEQRDGRRCGRSTRRAATSGGLVTTCVLVGGDCRRTAEVGLMMERLAQPQPAAVLPCPACGRKIAHGHAVTAVAVAVTAGTAHAAGNRRQERTTTWILGRRDQRWRVSRQKQGGLTGTRAMAYRPGSKAPEPWHFGGASSGAGGNRAWGSTPDKCRLLLSSMGQHPVPPSLACRCNADT